MQIPMYTGFCTLYTEYSDRLASHCNGESYDDDHSYQQDIYWYEESYYRTSHEISEHHRKSDISQLDITSGIDSDIADIAAQLMKGDSVLDVVDNMAAKDDWRSRIGFSKSVYQSQPVKTRTMKLNDCSEVVVNIIKTTYPLLHKKTISNTKKPCHTPCLPVHRQNTFKQIPVSSNSLLQRSHNKLNFLSSKQKADPSNELIRSKSDCEVNFSNIWDNINQRFVVCSAYENRRLSRVPAVFTSTSVPISVVTENRKRKASSSFSIQPPTKRQNIATKKSQVRNQAASSYCDLFATPLFIPSKQNQPVCFSSATKNSGNYRQQ
ncbi:uncharacterized protein LOC127735743 [Mytilus californianus]|uniref:uncharacterized protein LOC127735743 n=1 Tax=Mytilus californianus TaxID=6549 RepID=UPI002247726A|nr:uncharacterized protein LOC127735743 [Mytilus californianus]